MGKSLSEIAQELKANNKKFQLIYAFNGTGKTRLSREFKTLLTPKEDENDEESEEFGLENKRILYYNAFTEDLFYWDNDLENDVNLMLKIHPNAFTEWIFEEQGQEPNVINNFQNYTNTALTPKFSSDFSYVTFSYKRGNEEPNGNIKISKGEESSFIWSVFYSFVEQVVEVLNVPEESNRETNQFDSLEYVFIDDPVSSLDDNNLIELAVNLADVIESSKSKLKFIITTHNPLFYNVLHNEFRKVKSKKYILKKDESNEYDLVPQKSDSPFSYHLFLISEIEKAIETGQLKKYHFNCFRNILEKTSTFLGYENWGELLQKDPNDNSSIYENKIKRNIRTININSHSKYATEESTELKEYDKRALGHMLKKFKENYKFK